MNEANPSAVAIIAGDLRPLRWNERVVRGDFMDDGKDGFEPWEGPAGFQADTFVKQIYRRLPSPPATKKSS